MKQMARRLINSILSVITTCVLMAAPVAAIVYASGPIEASNTRIVTANSEDQEHTMIAKLDELGARIHVWKPDILDDSIVAMVMNLRNPE